MNQKENGLVNFLVVFDFSSNPINSLIISKFNTLF